jgi:hypothetical protein
MSGRRTPRFLPALLGLCLTLPPLPAAAVSIDVFPSRQSVAPGATFDVEVRASGVPSQEVLIYFGLLLGYEANVLTALGVTFSDALGIWNLESFGSSALDTDPNSILGGGGTSAGYTGSYTQAVEFNNQVFLRDPSTTTGTQADFHYLKDLQTPEPVTLATIEFQLSLDAAPGDYPLALISDNDFSNPASGGFYDIKGRDNTILSLTTEDGEVSVSVPLPAPLLLLGPVVLWLGLLRHRPGRAVAA